MNIGNLTIVDRDIISDVSTIGYTGSANLTMNLTFSESSVFHSLIKEVLITTNLKAQLSIHCDTDWLTKPAVITLPAKAFEKKGCIWLSVAGHKDDGTIITTNAIRMDVERSNPIISFTPESDLSIQKQIAEAIIQYMDEHIYPKVNSLIKTSEDQQIEVKKIVDDFNTQLATGQLKGATIFNGSGDPPLELGKLNDYYLNTIDDDGQSGGWLYSKLESGWTKIVKLKGESTTKVGGNSFINAPIRKMWFITDDSTMSDDTKVAHIPVIQETTDGKLSLFIKTKADLVSLTSSRHESHDLQSAMIEEAGWRPMKRKMGELPSDARLLFEESSESEMIAGQRGLETSADHRLLASGIVQDGLALNTILTGGVGVLGIRGTAKVIDGTDPLILKYAGKYLGYFKDQETPYGISTSCIIEVLPWNDDNFRVIKAYYQNDGTAWMRCLRSGIWDDWKLIAGDVLLWEGSVNADNELLNLKYNVNMFGSFVLDMDYPDRNMYCPTNKNFMFTGSFVQGNNSILLMSAYLTKIDNLTLRNNYVPTCATIAGSSTTSRGGKIVKLVGRP